MHSCIMLVHGIYSKQIHIRRFLFLSNFFENAKKKLWIFSPGFYEATCASKACLTISDAFLTLAISISLCIC